MRYIVTVAALILSYGTTAGYAQKTFVYAPGTHSCEQYLAAVNGHPPGIGKEITHPQDGRFSDDHSVYMAWLHGFLSATNVWVTNEPNSIQSDGAAIWPAPGSEDTELGVLMELEVCHGETEVYPRVQA
jgi:hypothetical protein